MLCLFACCFAANEGKESPKHYENEKPASVRILLHSGIDGALVEVKGGYKVFDLKTGKAISAGRLGKRFYLYPHDDGIKWGEDFLGIYQIRIAPTKEQTTIFVNGKQYKGYLDIFHVQDKVVLVNELAVEDFIKSTLTPLFEKYYGSTVMEAVGIIARTNTYFQVLQNKDSFWHFEANKIGYDGYGGTHINPEVERAVDSTRYLVMTLEESPFASTWTENCAGKTARYDAIFRKNVASASGIDSALRKRG